VKEHHAVNAQQGTMYISNHLIVSFLPTSDATASYFCGGCENESKIRLKQHLQWEKSIDLCLRSYNILCLLSPAIVAAYHELEVFSQRAETILVNFVKTFYQYENFMWEEHTDSAFAKYFVNNIRQSLSAYIPALDIQAGIFLNEVCTTPRVLLIRCGFLRELVPFKYLSGTF